MMEILNWKPWFQCFAEIPDDYLGLILLSLEFWKLKETNLRISLDGWIHFYFIGICRPFSCRGFKTASSVLRKDSQLALLTSR